MQIPTRFMKREAYCILSIALGRSFVSRCWRCVDAHSNVAGMNILGRCRQRTVNYKFFKKHKEKQKYIQEKEEADGIREKTDEKTTSLGVYWNFECDTQ
jgi:hypothetical protein